MTQFFPPARCHCGVQDWHSLLWQHEVVLKPPLIGSPHHRHFIEGSELAELELVPPKIFWPSFPAAKSVRIVIGSMTVPFAE